MIGSANSDSSISHHSPHILWMAAQIIFGCLVFYFFYSGIDVMPVDFRVPEQLGSLTASAAFIVSLNPVKFPARIHR